MSQDGSTVYPFSGKQVRTMAQVKLAYENILDQNKTLLEMIQWCDSVEATHENIIVQLDDLLGIKEEKIINLKLQNQMGLEMYDMADHEIKREKKLKWIFVGTTTLLAGFLALSLL